VLLDRAKQIAEIVIIILAAVGLVFLFKWLAGNDRKEQTDTTVLKMEEANSMVTGYAYISVLWLKSKDGKHVVEDWFFVKPVPDGRSKIKFPQKEVDGFCTRLYHVAFGFKDLSQSTKDYETDAESLPEMMAIEAIRTSHRGNMEAMDCDAYDQVSSEEPNRRNDFILRRMVLDDLLLVQLRQACQSLAMLTQLGKQEAEEKRLSACNSRAAARADEHEAVVAKYIADFMITPTKEDPSEAAKVRDATFAARAVRALGWPKAVGEATGSLGSLTVTLSTVGSVSYERGWIFKSEEFYVRRDKTVVSYGTPVKNVETRSSNKQQATLVVTLEAPSAIARDRHIDFLFATPEFKDKKLFGESKDELGYTDRMIVRSVDWALKDIEPTANRLARAYARANLVRYAKARNVGLQLKFE
jgi:hypothetical protein